MRPTRAGVARTRRAPPWARRRSSIALGALAVGFGVALMATRPATSSRARPSSPPILALTTVIVVVRFFALARPLARYLERLASHDLALRGSRPDPRDVLRAHRAARARGARGVSPRRPRQPDGRDVDALQGLYLRGARARPRRSRRRRSPASSRSRVVLPPAAIVLALGLARRRHRRAGLVARLARGHRPVGRRNARAASSTAELVELLRGAPELVAYGREEDALARDPRGGPRARAPRSPRCARRGLADRLVDPRRGA